MAPCWTRLLPLWGCLSLQKCFTPRENTRSNYDTQFITMEHSNEELGEKVLWGYFHLLSLGQIILRLRHISRKNSLNWGSESRLRLRPWFAAAATRLLNSTSSSLRFGRVSPGSNSGSIWVFENPWKFCPSSLKFCFWSPGGVSNDFQANRPGLQLPEKGFQMLRGPTCLQRDVPDVSMSCRHCDITQCEPDEGTGALAKALGESQYLQQWKSLKVSEGHYFTTRLTKWTEGPTISNHHSAPYTSGTGHIVL